VRRCILVMLAVAAGCAKVDPPGAYTSAHASSRTSVPAEAPALQPACAEAPVSGAWPRAASGTDGIARVASRGLEQSFAPGRSSALRFLGAHLFDLLDKVASEGGTEAERRRLVCVALEACAATGAPVVRIWGSLKHTGAADEVARAAEALELVLDENARRQRPLRFVVALLNHQPGYGSPRPERSLDDQDPSSGWAARQIYLEDGWRSRGRGLLAERIEAFAARRIVQSSPYVLTWELVNELDTFRVVGPELSGAQAGRLRDAFLVPAAALLARSFPQPVAFGEIRAAAGPPYVAFARELVGRLSPDARQRLVWTSHVYAPLGGDSARATAKLDLDLAFAAESGLPFVVGEIGQHVPGTGARFCADGPRHDLDSLFREVLGPRTSIDRAIFWGEGHCRLDVGRGLVAIGAGGDSADLGPNETEARSAVAGLRRTPRFRTEP